MSRFTVFIHEHFGTGAAGETAADIILRFIPDTGTLGTVKEVVADAVAIMEGTGISGAEKKRLATLSIGFALSAMHVTVPAAVVSFLIEEAVLLLKGGKSNAPPVVAPPPVAAPVDPTSIEYDTESDAVSHTTAADSTVRQKPNGKFIVWPSQFPGPGTQVYP